MGEAFITRRGGGTPYAVIGVTYPSGSVCTCTNGTLTLTAKGTGGKAIFVIPSAGTWTVKAVKGSDSASKAVSITAEGQAATVTLVFTPDANTGISGSFEYRYDITPVVAKPITVTAKPGACSSWRITNTDTAEFVEVVQPLTASSVIRMDFDKEHVTVNGSVAQLNIMSDFFTVKDRAHIKISSGTALLEWEERWL